MPSIALPVSLRGQLLSGIRSAVPAFSPANLFSTGSQGIWLDPSDLSTMFSDRAGTTPVTAPGTVVGLRLDKSRGATAPFGPERVINGDFTANADGWTAASAALSVASNQLVVTNSAAALGGASQAIAVTAGRTYTVSGQNVGGTGSPNSNVGSTLNGGDYGNIGGAQNWSRTFVATGPTIYISLRCVDAIAGRTAIFDSVSVKEWTGNHAVAPTDAARPIYGVEPKGGRRNLLTYSEQFDNAVWTKSNATVTANATAAPDGTTTADKLNVNTVNAQHILYNNAAITLAIGTTYVWSVYVKAAEYSWICVNAYDNANRFTFFDVSNGVVGTNASGNTASITSVGNGWWRCTVSRSAGGTGGYMELHVASADNTRIFAGANTTDGILIWGAQLELGSTASPYQRVTTAYDVTESGVPTCHYVQYDGSDDSMSTAAIDFTATDKMSVFAGVRKLSDAAIGLVAELSSGYGSNAGSFNLTAPDLADGTRAYATQSRGTATAASTQRSSTATGAAPDSAVLSGLLDISGDSSVLRRNGVASTAGTGDQGTGNYGNHPMFFGRRNNATLPFSGKDYGIIVVGKAASAGEIADTELWLSDKTAEVDVAKSISPNIYTRSGDTILDRANSIIERRA